MPLRHTDKGWYWGSKGPFDTKAKAMSVARAAYASGYREQEGIEMDHNGIKKLMQCLMCAQITLRLIHWNTTSYAEHKAVGKLYDQLADLQDGLAEAYMGIYGRFGNIEVMHKDMPNAADYVNYLAEEVAMVRAEIPNDTQLQNMIDEVASAIDTTAYLLTLK